MSDTPQPPTQAPPTFIRAKDYVRSIHSEPISSIDPDNLRCPFCWDDFRDAKQAKESGEAKHSPIKTACGHLFGRNCLLESMKKSLLCPLCRQTLCIIDTESIEAQLHAHKKFGKRKYQAIGAFALSNQRVLILPATFMNQLPEIMDQQLVTHRLIVEWREKLLPWKDSILDWVSKELNGCAYKPLYQALYHGQSEWTMDAIVRMSKRTADQVETKLNVKWLALREWIEISVTALLVGTAIMQRSVSVKKLMEVEWNLENCPLKSDPEGGVKRDELILAAQGPGGIFDETIFAKRLDRYYDPMSTNYPEEFLTAMGFAIILGRFIPDGSNTAAAAHRFGQSLQEVVRRNNNVALAVARMHAACHLTGRGYDAVYIASIWPKVLQFPPGIDGDEIV